MEQQTAALINQQLAAMHTQTLDPTADDLEAQEPNSVRVCLQMQQARVHVMQCIQGLIHQHSRVLGPLTNMHV